MLGGHLAAQTPQVQGRFEEVVDLGQALAGVGVQVSPDPVEHLLGGGEAPGGLDDEDLLGSGLDEVEFPVGADVVDAGVGPGVGQEDQPLVEPQSQAIGHGAS